MLMTSWVGKCAIGSRGVMMSLPAFRVEWQTVLEQTQFLDLCVQLN
jgi:hypothetical protein